MVGVGQSPALSSESGEPDFPATSGRNGAV